MKFERLQVSEVPWPELDRFGDRTVFQTAQWLRFVEDAQKAEIVVARIRDDKGVVGYFSGLITHRLGIRILGSPFRGWMTNYMGFNLVPGVSRANILRTLRDFAFSELKCLHVEIRDRMFHLEEAQLGGFACRDSPSYETDLTISKDALFGNLDRNRKRRLRAAEKAGVSIEIATDPEFVGDFYPQLVEVYAQRRLPPPYTRALVDKLVYHLLPTGNLLLLRARDASGKCIASAIYVGMNKSATYWGTGSFRSSLNLGPNETLNWFAMCYWKERGVEVFDWSGRGDYKQRYGATLVSRPRFIRSRFRLLETLRDTAERSLFLKQRLLGAIRPSRVEF